MHDPCDLTLQETFQDPQQLWQKAKGSDGTHKEWYQGAVHYWDQQEASYDGVLGGFGYVSDYDISDSKQLLQRVSGAVDAVSSCHCEGATELAFSHVAA